MNLFSDIKADLVRAAETLIEEGVLPRETDLSRVTVEPPRDPSHGDMATNAAMVLAKPASLKPRDLADRFAALLTAGDKVASADVAGPGFINVRLADGAWRSVVSEILRLGTSYGDSDLGGGRKVNVEYVSANPTGPMHIGHARGAVVGDALAGLLAKAGFDVCKEYWVNDAGAQIDSMGWAVYWRYLEILEPEVYDITDEQAIKGFMDSMGVPDKDLEYRGDYLIPVAEGLHREYGGSLALQEGNGPWKGRPVDEWMPKIRLFAVAHMLERIKEDLAELGVTQEEFVSERDVIESGKVSDVLNWLTEQDLIYRGILEPPKGQKPEDWEPREQTLFRATQFGDDVDRPLQKSDGSWTYFASDIAYHRYKYQRGFNHQINIWGADHGGYVKRMQAAVKAVSNGEASLTVKLCQMVRLMDKGEPVKMSKRAGNFVTLRELVDAVGKDVVRFYLLTRKSDAPLDFDLSAVKEQSRDNMVFYVQYAHARGHSVFRMAADQMPGLDISADALKGADLSRLTEESEKAVVKLLAEWPRQVEAAAEAEEPHRIAYYLYDLASAFHGWWTKGKEDTALRFIQADDADVTKARLALVMAVRIVIASGLSVFGVEPVEELN
ncbi:arginine--tRNA ligase [Rhodospirillaceae bacterium KN72]|uniref:Arginine--tRNA ligase n=1 Tax=Pacificispira spongiicola TaxID=2729598 RepID=A0A7Y0DYT4_9PROT|nr:arginine--tRNA ligase [Pacificispira spongiicola]NMM44096.1 arginine--tRNA ligase [Pacificispira spongiicola]